MMGSPEQSLNVDFAALAIADEDFAKIYRANDGYVDFQDPETVQQLTKSILKRDFKLKIQLPNDRLCPPVPVRYEYIRWLQNLIDTTNDSFTDTYEPERNVVGIDLGVGASCIYPLLGCAARPRWRFGGTELDDKSFESAKINVALNKLEARIRLRKTEPSSPLLDLAALGIKQADFVMCNPPFFTSKADMLATHLSKKRSPSAVCTGAEVEMITDGGDLGFVTRLIEESQALNDRIQWYSSMLGKLSSVHAVVAKLKQMKISNWAVTSLQAGNVTRRWVLAWSYGDLRPKNSIARGSITTKEILPFPSEANFAIDGMQLDDSVEKLNEIMDNLDLSWEWNQAQLAGLCFAQENVWSRSARRKRQRQRQPKKELILKEEDESEDDMEDAVLGARISLASSSKMASVRWLKGTDSVLFESFCGMLKRSMAE